MFDKKILTKIKSGEAFLISSSINSFYLSGFVNGVTGLFLTRTKAYLLTDSRYFAEAKVVCGKNFTVVDVGKLAGNCVAYLAMKNKIKTVYFESENLSYKRALKYRAELNDVAFKPFANFVAGFRIAKRADEIVSIVKAQRIAEKALCGGVAGLKVGVTEEQVAWQIEKLGRELGADAVSFAPIIAFGKSSACPHHESGNRKLKKGDIVLIDIGFKYKGYCSDMTRMLFTAKPTSLQAKVYNVVLDAQNAAIKMIKAGVDSCDVDAAARGIITRAGYGKNFLHSLGHGVGLEIHEEPRLNGRECNPLPKNSVVTVEPGIYIENSFGVRIEDMVLVKGDKSVNLTNVPKLCEECIVKIK
jgi:Xaa-Pro aminopeptidase